MTDHRHRTIRLYTVLAACLACALFWPVIIPYLFASLPFILFGLFLPLLDATPAVVCANCNGAGNNAPATFQLDVSGIGDGSCSPGSTEDGSFVLTYDGSCQWSLLFSCDLFCPSGTTCNAHYTTCTHILIISQSGSNYLTTVDSNMQVDHGTSKPNCTQFSSLSLSYTGSENASHCVDTGPPFTDHGAQILYASSSMSVTAL